MTKDPEAGGGPRGAAKILVVEDEGPVGLDIQLTLEDMGYVVTSVAPEASEALGRVEREAPDLIVMDIQLLGDMDGIEAAHEVRDRFGIPVLFLTAFADSGTINRAREAGAYGYLLKPFESRELRAMVEVALCKHRLEADRRQLDERIQRAQRLESLRTMAGGIAHRFNNALHAVLGNLAFALEDAPSSGPTRRFLRESEKAARKAVELSNLMLSFTGHGVVQSQEIEVSAFVEQAKELVESLTPSAVVLELELAEGLPCVLADPQQLKQILLALAQNAKEALGDRSGTITIRTSVMECGAEYLATLLAKEALTEGPYISLEIVDTGCGMSEETVQRVFDPFFSTKFTGRGLGLASVLGIVHAHRGAVKVHSEWQRGTIVKVLLPACPGRKIEALETVNEAIPCRGNGTVLVVDDDNAVRSLAKAVLERAGFFVLTAVDGREAVEVFREHSDDIDVVLLDLTMPHKNGGQAFREIREIRPDVNVILSSGYDEAEARSRFDERDLASFLKKPYVSATLISKLNAVLNA